MLPPLPRCSGWAYSSLIAPSRVSLPRKGRRVGLHIVLFEACSAFTRVAACTLARPPIRGPLYRRLQPFRHLHDCSGCFRLERLPGGPCTHWKAPPFHGARHKRTNALQQKSHHSITLSARVRAARHPDHHGPGIYLGFASKQAPYATFASLTTPSTAAGEASARRRLGGPV